LPAEAGSAYLTFGFLQRSNDGAELYTETAVSMNQQDRALIQELIDGSDKHLEARTAIAQRNQRWSAALAKARQLEVANTQKEEAAKTRRRLFLAIIVGIVAVIAGGWVAQIIHAMSSDMSTMAQKWAQSRST
jgi:hypothetical protein